ncbi:hypothetical protein KGF86_08110 [Ornithinibacillus massiliensis]|uniref:Uncharacterized protein n=1 Tax=Ornithinibacillus massiliensis TaxID=1944633 RepID=A0ABS5ME50_9BACI|nr:hypothetical protein [Ornithinibacillus massiliensis]MBS3680177.1 hypothetical protein [Ornithinibacillus massiliensis]
MKKRYIVSAIGAGIAGYLIGANKFKKHPSSNDSEISEDLTFFKAGKPDEVDELELDQLENAKMVSEGSQFGVQYYNNIKATE